MKVVDGTLRIRSPRTALGYVGASAPPLADPDGYVDTGDILERTGIAIVLPAARAASSMWAASR
jgi:hypothetical protein